MIFIIEDTISGILMGSIYGLAALGLTLIFGVLKVINFAHGSMLMVGMYTALRFMDETLYLRSDSINIFNGLVGLTFSCDGSHYMPWNEFLDKNLGFWLGSTGSSAA